MKSALLVIDCQNDFIKNSSPYQCGMLDDGLISNIADLIKFCRKNRIPVVYTQHGIKSDKSNAEFGEPINVRACIIGTRGWEIIDSLKPANSEPVVQKDKYDAFYGTDLQAALQKLDAEQLIICGVLTNNCVRATAEGAHYRNYKITLIEDCCGGTSYVAKITDRKIHDITLKDLCERMYETKTATLSKFKSFFGR